MDCMMACLAECTELWPDAAMEPCGDDSKDDGDVECNHHRDPWREGRPVEAWQAEQVTDGGHENKPPCSALPAPSSKDPSGQRERCGSATGQDTSERFDASSTPTARQQQPSPGSAGSKSSKSSQEVPDYCGQQEPSPAFAAAAERAAAAALRAARAMAHAEEAAHVAREAESSADRAVKAATSAAHRITPRQAHAASSPQGLQLQLEEPQQHQQHQQQFQLEQQQLQLEKQKQQLEEQKQRLQHQQRLLEQEELEQQQLYLTEGEDEEDDDDDEEEEEVRGRLDSAAGLSTSDFQQQQQQSQPQLHRFDVTPIKQGGGSSTRLRAVEVENASAWTTATTRSGSLTSKATPLTTPLTSASASGAGGGASGGGGGGGFSSSSMSVPPPGSPLDFHHDAMSTTDRHYHREHRDNSANNHHQHHHHHPHQHQHHHDHYRSERGERVRSTALASTCTNRGSVGGIDSDGVSDLSDSDLSAIMTASLMGQITPKDDCSLSGDATPRGRGGGGGGSSGGWATYSVEEVLRGSGAGGSASDAWVAAAAAATPSQVGSIGSGSVGRTRDGGSASAAWPGPMYRRAASMGTEWLKLDQPEDTSTSKHKSMPRRYARLANPDSEPERAREDSGIGGLGGGGGGGGSSGSSRFGRGWNVDPGGSLERKGVPPTPSKALVTTHLRHLRLSPDGAVMMVQPNDGQAEYEFVLADLIEVRENIPQETVTLIGRQVKIRIAFEGQTVALKQFSAMLAPAWKPRTSTVDSVEPAATEWESRRGNEVEQATEADEEEGPISHPERLVRSSEPIQSSRSAPSSRTTMTRASAMWQAADVRSGTTSIGWESLMISPVVSIQSGGGWEPVGALSKKLSLPALFDSFSGSNFDSPAPSAVGVQAMSATASDYYEAGGRSPISMLVSSQQHHHHQQQQQQQQQQQEMKSSRRRSSSRGAPLARRRHREPEDAVREGMTLTLPSLMDAGEPPEEAMPSFEGIQKTQQLCLTTDHALVEPYISSSRGWRVSDEMDRRGRGESSGELRSAA